MSATSWRKKMRVKRAKLSWWDSQERKVDKYQTDPRWEKARELTQEGKFTECADLVCRINKNHGEPYK